MPFDRLAPLRFWPLDGNRGSPKQAMFAAAKGPPMDGRLAGVPKSKTPADTARVAELADALDLGSSPVRGRGSSPRSRTANAGRSP
jgi:hypothetical protein